MKAGDYVGFQGWIYVLFSSGFWSMVRREAIGGYPDVILAASSYHAMKRHAAEMGVKLI